MMTTTKAQPNEYGVVWATSRSGELSIACGPDKGSTGGWDVWALYTGTHDLAPVSRKFDGAKAEDNARAYANQLWRDR